MRGAHAWSFAFAIPPDVRIKSKYDHAPVPRARFVRHVRRIALHVDSESKCARAPVACPRLHLPARGRIRTVFGSTPLLAPPPPLLLRARAHCHAAPLLDPRGRPHRLTRAPTVHARRHALRPACPARVHGAPCLRRARAAALLTCPQS
jgi:hypothetical protein